VHEYEHLLYVCVWVDWLNVVRPLSRWCSHYSAALFIYGTCLTVHYIVSLDSLHMFAIFHLALYTITNSMLCYVIFIVLHNNNNIPTVTACQQDNESKEAIVSYIGHATIT
jgi:hypothetical protein